MTAISWASSAVGEGGECGWSGRGGGAHPRVNSTAPASATQSKSSHGQTSLYSWMVCDEPSPAPCSMTRFARTIPCTAPGVSRSSRGMKVAGASALMIFVRPSGVINWSTRAPCSVFSVQLPTSKRPSVELAIVARQQDSSSRPRGLWRVWLRTVRTSANRPEIRTSWLISRKNHL